MNDLQVFENNHFGKIRTLTINSEPWFVAKDISDVLGYSDTFAMTKRLDSDEIKTDKTAVLNILNGKTGTTFINESGLYHAILGSKKETATQFRKWVTSEVLPSIRKHGVYATDEAIDQIINNPDFGIKLLSQLKQERLEKEKAQNELSLAKPKVDVYDAFIDSTGTYSVADSAKILKLPYGCVKLYEKLRAMNILGKDNSPFEDQVKEGRFIRVPVQKIINGKTETFPTTRVTPKGLEYISKRLGITK